MNTIKVGPELLEQYMAESNMPRNQVASMSGLTNTYLRSIVLGKVKSISRQRIIRLSLALSLGLKQVDSLLHAFDRTELTIQDIPIFMEAYQEMTVSGALHPVSCGIAYDLYINAARRVPGDLFSSLQVISDTLQVPRHYEYLWQSSAEDHPILLDLRKAINQEKYMTLVQLLETHKVENVACRHCLEEYLYDCKDIKEKFYRVEHVRSLIRFLQEQKNFHFYISDVCSRFQFSLKFPDKSLKQTDKVWFMGKQLRSNRPHPRSKLIAFATDNPQLVATFKAEMEIVKEAAIKDLLPRDKMIDFLGRMIGDS